MFYPADFCASFGLLNDEPIYRPDEVAEIFECDIGHIYDLIRTKKLRASDISTGRKPIWRIRYSAIVTMLEASQIAPSVKESERCSITDSKVVADASPLSSLEVVPGSTTGAFSARRATRKGVSNGKV